LVVRKIFGHIHKDIGNSQRGCIFHLRCLINNKVCILITNGGSCTNVASKRLVEKHDSDLFLPLGFDNIKKKKIITTILIQKKNKIGRNMNQENNKSRKM